MNTIQMSAEINQADVLVFKSLLKKYKAKKVVFQEKDDTKMSKEAFFAKIDKARTGKTIKMSREEMRNFLLSKAL